RRGPRDRGVAAHVARPSRRVRRVVAWRRREGLRRRAVEDAGMSPADAEAICRATGWTFEDGRFRDPASQGYTYREPERDWHDADAALLAWMGKHSAPGVGLSRVAGGWRVWLLGTVGGHGRTLPLAACDALAEYGRSIECGRVDA